jgi:hypothetical protein
MCCLEAYTLSNVESRVKVRFVVESLGEAKGEFARFLSPRTVDGILRKLPLEGRAAIWNEEVYFKTPIEMGPEKPKPKVETGAVAFWPIGSAICIFYGRTQPYSPVNMLGNITENLELFRSVKEGQRISLLRIP